MNKHPRCQTQSHQLHQTKKLKECLDIQIRRLNYFRKEKALTSNLYSKFELSEKIPKLEKEIEETKQEIAEIEASLQPPDNPDLELNNGSVPFDSRFYIERNNETQCKQHLQYGSTLVLIKAPRQCGKTSLLIRLKKEAENLGQKVVSMNFQGEFDSEQLQNLDILLKMICEELSYTLGLEDKIEEYWASTYRTSKQKATRYFQKYLLKNTQEPILLAIDEADKLFSYEAVSTEFFGLLRAWHEKSKEYEVWQKFKMILTYSMDARYAIRDSNQSPFNVGFQADMNDFTDSQITYLAGLHGLSWWKNSDTKTLQNLIGGHPYLVRKALYEITTQKLSIADFITQANTDEGYFADYLKWYLELLDQTSEKRKVFKAILNQQPSREYLTCEKLRAIGLIKGNYPNYKPRYELFTKFFKQKI